MHLAPFPVDRGHREPELLAAMNTVRRLASLARAARESRNLRVRQPLARMQLAVPAAVQGPALSDLLDILAAEVNVKSVQVVASDHDLVRLRGKANFRTLGKRYGKDTPQAAAAAAELTPEQLQALEQSETVTTGAWEFRPEDVTVTREVASEWLVQADGPYVVALDPELSDDLVQEGLAREVVNRVQRLRGIRIHDAHRVEHHRRRRRGGRDARVSGVRRRRDVGAPDGVRRGAGRARFAA